MAFKDIYQQIEAQYGAKAEKPREIKKSLGKDDFLRIMITQMKHQDPTNPFKAEQMASEMAQFASVEQLQNVNQSLQKMSQQNVPLERMALTNLIGKMVTTNRGLFSHSDGSKDVLSFHLPKDAATSQILVQSESGEMILQKEIGPFKAGEQSFIWDGMKSNLQPARAGNYVFKVQAVDEMGVNLPLSDVKKGLVVGISFEGTEPYLLVGDAKNQERVPVRSLSQVEETRTVGSLKPLGEEVSGAKGDIRNPRNLGKGTDASASGLANQRGGVRQGGSGGSAVGSGDQLPTMGAAEAAAQRKKFFSFTKGVGSKKLDISTSSPEVQAAIQKYQEGLEEGQKMEKGFPNGLQEGR